MDLTVVVIVVVATALILYTKMLRLDAVIVSNNMTYLTLTVLL